MSETFGRYTVIRQLGRGAMGVVYLASDPMLNRQVAVKTVDLSVEEPTEREFLRNRLLRDARAAAVLKHPNIVAIYDVFEDAGRAYVVMEYIEGDSLAAKLKANPLPDASALLKVLRQMADALDYTHARGVVHRDIKPANVMIDTTGTTKIMDFGIARMSDTRTCTPTGMVMGTVEYMAPEQILGETADGRADQFALAVVAYQMMTGSTLYGPNTVATLTYKIVHEMPVLPRSRNATLPIGVDMVLAKALSKKPDDRFATCTEFAMALATAFSDAPTAPLPAPTAQVGVRNQTTVAMSSGTAVPEPVTHSRAPIIAAAVAVVLLGGALAAVILKPWKHTTETPASIATFVAPPVTTPPAASTPAVNPPAATTPAPPPEPKADVKPSPTTVPAVHEPEPKKVADPPKPEPKSVTPPAKSPAVESTTPLAEPTGELELPILQMDRKNTVYQQALQRGQQQVKANDYPGALDSFAKAVALHPESGQARYSRGAVYQHMGQWDAARQDFVEALRLEPRLVIAHTGLGNCLAHEHHDPEALVEFQRAIELNPNASMALFGRGNIYMRRQQYAPALADYDRVVQISPHYAPVYMNRAKAREAIGDFPGAAGDRRMEQSLRK